MNDDSFGPLAVIAPFAGVDEAATEANRLHVGPGFQAFTGSDKTANAIAAAAKETA